LLGGVRGGSGESSNTKMLKYLVFVEKSLTLFVSTRIYLKGFCTIAARRAYAAAALDIGDGLAPTRFLWDCSGGEALLVPFNQWSYVL